MAINLCIQTEANASTIISAGTEDGVVNNICDDNLTTTHGAHDVTSTPGAVIIAYTDEVSWSTPTLVTSASVIHWAYPSAYTGGNWALSLYYGGGYTQVSSGTFPSTAGETSSVSGTWSSVTKARLIASGLLSIGGTIPPGITIQHAINELQVWGDYIYVPSVITLSATDIGTTLATLQGSISSTGGVTVTTRGFDWGTSTAYGSAYTTTGTFGISAFSYGNTNLVQAQTYYYRGKAYNSVGWGYGSAITFVTVSPVEAEKRMSRLVYDEMMEYMMEEY